MLTIQYVLMDVYSAVNGRQQADAHPKICKHVMSETGLFKCLRSNVIKDENPGPSSKYV